MHRDRSPGPVGHFNDFLTREASWGAPAPWRFQSGSTADAGNRARRVGSTGAPPVVRRAPRRTRWRACVRLREARGARRAVFVCHSSPGEPMLARTLIGNLTVPNHPALQMTSRALEAERAGNHIEGRSPLGMFLESVFSDEFHDRGQ